MRAIAPLATWLFLAGCQGEIHRSPVTGPTVVPGDAGAAVTPDAARSEPVLPDAAPPDATAPEPALGMLAEDLAVARVDLYQSVRVPLARDGVEADRDGLPVVADREALVRIHVSPLAGYRAREVTAVVEIDLRGETLRFTDTRTPALPSDDADPASLFAVDVPREAVQAGAFFRVRLEAEDGVSDAPDATYPRDGRFADLRATILAPITVVLVPLRYETDGSGRLPDTSEAQLERYRDELTSRLPFAEVDLRVHDAVTWSESTRSNGNVDWGDVNAMLIALRDEEGAPVAEYWYALAAPSTSRSSYCRSTSGSCVTGQSYVATLHGTRVGSGVGFGDVASVRTFAHELGHMHGRYHSPCGTSGTDEDYPYDGGLIGTWGWDRRDGSFHDPDVATDMLGYCDRQWISDYNYLAIFERHVALRATLAARSVAPTPAVLRRFVTVDAEGRARLGAPVALHGLPGEAVRGTYLDAEGAPIGALVAGSLTPAHGGEHVYVLPATAPSGARAVTFGETTIALP